EVRSAGGGGKTRGKGEHKRDTHVGLFRGVDNAEAIRAAVLDRIRRHRDAGLGDPDDEPPRTHEPIAAPAAASPRDALGDGPSLLGAARGLAAEARALREALARAAG